MKTSPPRILFMFVALEQFSRFATGLSVSSLASRAVSQKGLTRHGRSCRNVEGTYLQALAEPMSTAAPIFDDLVLDPLIICGPSGVGKGTIISKFMEDLGGKDSFDFTVSHTTRDPRPGEENGVHYHYVAMEIMKTAIADQAFLEYAEVHGNFYGTSWDSLRQVQRTGKRALLDIDVQGVKNIKTLESDTLQPKYVFIAPPSLEILSERLIGRGTESPESLARRTANAKAEVEYGLLEGNFDAIVVNQELEASAEEFRRIIRDLYDL